MTPSGGEIGDPGPKATPPVTKKLRKLPAVREESDTRTGDCAGAMSPRLAVDPSGIPASHGSAVPGTVNVSAEAANVENASAMASIRPGWALVFMVGLLGSDSFSASRFARPMTV